MNKLIKSAVLPAAAIVAAAGFGNAASAQSVTVPPVPAMPPPLAAHSDPTLPVPTIPPEQLGSWAPAGSGARAQAQIARLQAKAWARFVPIVDRSRREQD